MDDMKNIFDKFNRESLKNEDWLEPNPMIFDAIEKRLEPKSRNRKPLWVLFFLVVGFLGFAYLAYSPTSIESNDIEGLSFTESPHNTKEPSENSDLQEIKTPSDVDHDIGRNKIDESQKELNQQALDLSITSDKPLTETIKNQSFDDISTYTTSQTQKALFETPINLKSTLSPNKVLKEMERVAIDLLSIKRMSLDFLSHQNNNRSINPAYAEPIEAIHESPRLWNLGIMSSIVQWEDELNSNYTSALSPADFSHGSSSGYQMEVSLGREFTNKINLGVSLSYSRFENVSGHNAILNYNAQDENDYKNQFQDITLATPYGFVSSEFVIERSSSNQDQSISLLSAIHSKHVIQTLDLGIWVNYELLKWNRFNLSIQPGIHYTHLLSIKNDLDYLTTNHSDFSFDGGTILNEQAGLNSGFTSFSLGVFTSYDLSNRCSIQVGVTRKQGLNPIFNEGEFSGTARILCGSLGLRYSLF